MSRQSFFELIDRLSNAPAAERPEIEASVWSTFGVERALLALDMSNFSLSVRRHGILHYLGLIRRMQRITAPIVREYQGEVIKYEADNLLATFTRPEEAAHAAVAIQRALKTEAEPARTDALTAAIGIDFGRYLLIAGDDCYGDAVNIACKLGEDLARGGEILLTVAAREQLGRGFPHPLEEQHVSLSGLELTTFSVQYAHAP